jgi:hypothetical protein
LGLRSRRRAGLLGRVPAGILWQFERRKLILLSRRLSLWSRLILRRRRLLREQRVDGATYNQHQQTCDQSRSI